MDDERLVIGVEEAATLADVSRGLAFDMVRQGLWPAVRCGRRWLVNRRLFEAYLEGRWQPPAKGKSND